VSTLRRNIEAEHGRAYQHNVPAESATTQCVFAGSCLSRSRLAHSHQSHRRIDDGHFLREGDGWAGTVCDIVNELAETLTTTDRFKNICLARDFKADPTITIVVSIRMKQLIANLLTNAMESGADTARVRVEVGSKWRSPRRHGLRITVADNGCGTRPLDREKVFEPFFYFEIREGCRSGVVGKPCLHFWKRW
jgi:K+-sensing histidine kinase KdpD